MEDEEKEEIEEEPTVAAGVTWREIAEGGSGWTEDGESNDDGETGCPKCDLDEMV